MHSSELKSMQAKSPHLYIILTKDLLHFPELNLWTYRLHNILNKSKNRNIAL